MPGKPRYYSGGRNQTRKFNRKPKQQNRRGPKKANINPSKFIRRAQPVEEVSYTPKHKFADFKLNELIKLNLKKMGFEDPSPIQDEAIEPGLARRNILGIANTGTGKTAAFAVPVLNKLINDKSSKVIILAPTRELAEQIEQQCKQIAKGSGIFGALLIGGTSMGPQLRDLRNQPRIVIGTPGRIKDHLKRGSLNIDDFDTIVLDEVDRMLDMGFIGDITYILSLVKKDRQSFYFSATLDSRVKSIIDKFSNDIVQISVKSSDTSANVNQDVVEHKAHEKIEKLHDILIHQQTTKTIIFDDTQRMVERLSKELSLRGFSAEAIHGGRSQSQRQRVLKKFKSSEINVLVATDVAARGLDVSDISHVINYSLPQTYDDYVHRIGRTGRAGKVGQALTFIER